MNSEEKEKIKLFREIFHGRQDIVSRFWISKDGKKTGYSITRVSPKKVAFNLEA